MLVLTALAMVLTLCSCAVKNAPEPADGSIAPKPEPVDPFLLRAYQYTRNDGTVLVREREVPEGTVTVRSKTFDMPDGDVVFAGTVTGEEGEEVCVLEFTADLAQLHWSDGSEWHEELQPQEGDYQAGCLFVDTEDEYFAIYMPQCYDHIENGCVRYRPEQDGYLRIELPEDGGVRLSLYAVGGGEGATSDFFLARCHQSIIDWANENEKGFWKAYTNEGDGRFLYTGYYWISSTLNETSGENVYANNVACYFGKSFVYGAPFYDAMNDMALYLLDAMLDLQNEDGYWASNVISSWLHSDYGIDGPYYDTRFNSDFVKILMLYYRDTGVEEFLDPLGWYFDFYQQFAETCGWELDGGLAVPDYYYPGMTTPHMALNHQLAEIDVLYEAAELTGRTELAVLGDRMLTAIENSAPRWIRSDSNLHYSIHPDGQLGGQDYPYLTYNDLFEMQAHLEEMGRPRSDALQLLMDAKKTWMDAHGVTGYKK